MLISHLEHSEDNVLAKAEGYPRNLALLKMRALRRAIGHRLCSTIFARRRCGEENKPILIKSVT
jgi:hypothetical protein